MKNINNESDFKYIQERISNLTPESKGLWGTMNVNQMLSHLADDYRMMAGEIKVKDKGNFFTHTVLRWATFAGAPVPKSAKTYPEIDQVARGVNPADFSKCVDTLNSLMLDSLKPIGIFYHPLFGNLTDLQRGRVSYIHMNHHLKQFGV